MLLYNFADAVLQYEQVKTLQNFKKKVFYITVGSL